MQPNVFEAVEPLRNRLGEVFLLSLAIQFIGGDNGMMTGKAEPENENTS